MEYVDKYRIIKTLGQGGMGVVYEALDEKIRSRVAVKILNRKFVHDVDVMTRFLNEAHIANSIAHPGIVKIFDHGFLPSGEAYFVMEFLDGKPLRAKAGSVCSDQEILRLGKQTASVLAAAHAIGIVHRDLKPDNLMLITDPDVEGGERIRVLDFGIARISRPENLGDEVDLFHLTQTGMLIGTPMYMAPEQCSSAKTVDGKADVYALGVILYELACGQAPFVGLQQDASKPSNPGAAAVAILFAHLNQAPPSLLDRNPKLNKELAGLIHRLLSKSPDDRPTMRELLGEIQRIQFNNAKFAHTGKNSIRNAQVLKDSSQAGVPGTKIRHVVSVSTILMLLLLAVSVAAVFRNQNKADVISEDKSTIEPIHSDLSIQDISDLQMPEQKVKLEPSRTQRLPARPRQRRERESAHISMPISQLRAFLEQLEKSNNYKLILDSTLSILEWKRDLPSDLQEQIIRMRGTSACYEKNVELACASYRNLSKLVDKNDMLQQCIKLKLMCANPDSDTSGCCDRLRIPSSTLPPSLRDPFYRK